MKEAYVTFETAKLLKENGFDCECYGTYNIIEEVLMNEHSVTMISHTNKNSILGDAWISAPTQQMACRWLREEKGIHICTVPDLSSDKFYISIAINVNGKWRLHANFPAPLLDEKYIKCEDAVEAALEYCLTNLI